MDDDVQPPYVVIVNLLLLLSALLSALTGAQGSSRVEQSPVAVSRQAERTVVARVVRAIGSSPSVAVLPRPSAETIALPAGWVLAPAQPIYLSRRRE